MDERDFTEWDLLKLHDSFTLVEAACIIIGSLPAGLTKKRATNDEPYGMPSFGCWDEGFNNNEWCSDPQGRDNKLESVLKALMKAVRDGKLPSDYIPIDKLSIDIDPWHIEVETDALKAWLLTKNIKPAFFFGELPQELDYLNPKHPRYSVKLAAAVKVWLAMEDTNLLHGKKPKAAMESWLESRYAELGLTYKGEINKTGISEAAKVANWEVEGGAPTTPAS